MALIYCPDCGMQVSEHAKACPNCGYPVYSKLESFLNGDSNGNFTIENAEKTARSKLLNENKSTNQDIKSQSYSAKSNSNAAHSGTLNQIKNMVSFKYVIVVCILFVTAIAGISFGAISYANTEKLTEEMRQEVEIISSDVEELEKMNQEWESEDNAATKRYIDLYDEYKAWGEKYNMPIWKLVID